MEEKISKNKVEVIIGGKVFTLVGVESEEYMQNVARYIDRKMSTVISAESSQVLSTHLTAILTSINVADDLFKEREVNELLNIEISKKEEELNRKDIIIQKYEDEFLKIQEENKQLRQNITDIESKLHDTQQSLSSLKQEFDEYLIEFDKKTS